MNKVYGEMIQINETLYSEISKIAEKKTIISEYHLTKRACENANTSTKCKYKI